MEALINNETNMQEEMENQDQPMESADDKYHAQGSMPAEPTAETPQEEAPAPANEPQADGVETPAEDGADEAGDESEESDEETNDEE